MDAVEFLKTKNRMCRQEGGCGVCPYGNMVSCNAYKDDDVEEIVRKAEQWSKEHLVKTRQSEFLKMFPNAFVKYNGVLSVLPCHVDRTVREACAKKTCIDCRREFWMQEVE